MLDISRFSAHPIIRKEEINAVIEVLRSGKLSGFRGAPGEGFLGGSKIRQFEQEFADYFGVKYAITFNSGTSALHGACVACGIKADDEVIVSPFTFTASAKCVLMAGGKPVFVDIKPDIFCIDPEKIVVTPKTKAIIPVHLCGHPADMDEIMSIAREHNLKVIEDSCQAIGAIYKNQLTGTIGDCGVFSFGKPKTITTGEGGMLITNDTGIAETARLVRNHGEMLNDVVLGYNYRMTEMQAALGIIQFRKLDTLNRTRVELCEYLTERLSKIDGITPPVVYPDCKHVYYTYAVRCDNREKLMRGLASKGIYFGAGYVKPLYLHPIYGGKKGDCPVAERMYDRELMVTDICRPPATIEEMDYIADTLEGLCK